jgi:hypothetical protein
MDLIDYSVQSAVHTKTFSEQGVNCDIQRSLSVIVELLQYEKRRLIWGCQSQTIRLGFQDLRPRGNAFDSLRRLCAALKNYSARIQGIRTARTAHNEKVLSPMPAILSQRELLQQRDRYAIRQLLNSQPTTDC